MRRVTFVVVVGALLACTGVGTGVADGPLFPVRSGKAGLMATYAYVHADGSSGVPGVFLYAERPGIEPAWVRTGAGWGVLGADGEYLLEPGLDFDSIQPFEHGVAIVEKNRERGLMRVDGSYLLPLGRHSISRTSESHWMVHPELGCYFIDHSGARFTGFHQCRGGDDPFSVRVDDGWTYAGLSQPRAHSTFDEALPFRGGRGWGQLHTTPRRGPVPMLPPGPWVLVDASGDVLHRLEPQDQPSPFSEGQARVNTRKGVVFVDDAGQVVHGPYDEATDLRGGLAYVRQGREGRVVDSTGATVFEVAGAAPKGLSDLHIELASFAHGAAWLPNSPKSFTAYDREGKRLFEGVSRPTAFDAEGWGSGIVDDQTVWVHRDGSTVGGTSQGP